MKRKEFMKTCGYAVIGLPLAMGVLNSCRGIYYANLKEDQEKLTISKKEFIVQKKDIEREREFILLKTVRFGFPVCLYKTSSDVYVASLLECTHRGCELNVGGGIYSCPCHGSEFSKEGEVLKGPADQKLKTFITKTDNENIYVLLS